ncbi:MAG: efflux RND transporter permease subunit, partial [Bacteroidales bacterium]|nr:efflux RND transporter permease subunit [Bacteroidales bacterium]
MKLSKISVSNPIGTSMAFIAILIIGIISLNSLPRDVMPDIDFPTLTVITIYPGASPEDVEKDVTQTLELILATTPNLKNITSKSRENVSFLTLQFEWESDITDAANNVRDLMEIVKNDLPSAAQAPYIMKINSSMLPVAALAISANESYDDFDRIYNDIIAPHFRRIEGVGTVFPIANPEKQLLIEIDPQRMDAYNISIQTIVMALQSEKTTIPGGNIKIGEYDLPINIPSDINNQSDIEELIIVNFQNKVIRLKDIASVSVKPKPKDERVRSAGMQSIAMFVQKQTGTNTLDTYKSILKEIENVQKVLPEDVQISEVFNTADIIDDTINNLASTVWWGALWVMFVVLIFLRNYRSSLIIIVTIPFSLIFAFIIIYIFDYTINVFSLMSLVVAMGLVVDSAIVVLENIIQKIEKGEKPREASVFGSSEMQLAITASTMTTISVFLPMLFLGGIVGIMFKQLVVITISILLASLVAALTLTPMMTSLLIKKRERKHSKLYNWSENIFVVVENAYKDILKWAIYHKTAVILVGIGIFGLSLFSVRFIGTDYIPNFDTGDMMIIIETDEGTGVNKTEEIATFVEEKVIEMVPYIEKSFIIAGQTEKGLLSSVGFAEGKNAATIGFRMCQPDKRPKSTSEIAAELTSFLDSIPDINKYNVSGGSILSAVVLGNVKPIEIKLFCNDFTKL